MSNNNVTAGSIKTPTLSADEIMIDGKTLKNYVQEKSTGSTVNPILTEGVEIAKILGEDGEKTLFAPQGCSNEYTEFEVFATDKLITSGSLDSNDKDDPSSVASIFDFDNTTATGLEYKMSVPPCMTQAFTLEGACDVDKEVVVDWGDGTIDKVDELEPLTIDTKTVSELAEEYDETKEYVFGDYVSYESKFYQLYMLNNGNPEVVNAKKIGKAPGTANSGWIAIDGNTEIKQYSGKNGVESKDQYEVVILHTYTKPGKYKVRIYSDKVYKIYGGIKDNSKFKGYNIISRVFDRNQHISSHLTNVSSLLQNDYKILSVTPRKYVEDHNIVNWSSTFQGAYNILKVDDGGYSYFFPKVPLTVNLMFAYCINMVTSTVRLPQEMRNCSASAYKDFYCSCCSMTSKVETLLPMWGFSGRCIDLQNVFANCSKMTGTVPSMILWNDKSKLWGPLDIKNLTTVNTKSEMPVDVVNSKYYYVIDEDCYYVGYANSPGSVKKWIKCGSVGMFSGCSDEIRHQVPNGWKAQVESDF